MHLVHMLLAHIVSTLQEQVNVAVQQSLVRGIVAAESLQECVSQFHYLLHQMILCL